MMIFQIKILQPQPIENKKKVLLSRNEKKISIV